MIKKYIAVLIVELYGFIILHNYLLLSNFTINMVCISNNMISSAIWSS